jgi:ABC-type uncharacterized transport system ATPase subunit
MVILNGKDNFMKLRLRNIQFKGFRSLTDCRLDVDSAVTTIVGENETGKTGRNCARKAGKF